MTIKLSLRRLRLFWFSLLLLVFLLLPPPTSLEAGAARQPMPKYLVMIVMDGFRPDYLNLALMRHLRTLMRQGTTYSRAWVGQLETQTPTGHATLATGIYPRKHGVIGFGWRDLSINNFTWMATDRHQLDAGRMEGLIEAGGVPTLSDLLHHQDPQAKSASISGEKYYAADALGTGADYILYGRRLGKKQTQGIAVAPIGKHIPPASTGYQKEAVRAVPYPWVEDLFVAHLGVRLLHTVRPRMLLMNFPGSDIWGHVTGGVINPVQMRHIAKNLDHAIGIVIDAYKRAGLYNRTLFLVTADHGMVPNFHLVPTKAMYSLMKHTSVLSLENDFLSTGGYIYLRNPADAPSVAKQMVDRHFRGVEGALYKDGAGSCKADPETARTLPTDLTRAYLHLCGTLAGPNGPEVVLPFAEDTMGLVVPHHTRWGNHGGLSWAVQHIPLILSGPGVRKSVQTFPAQLVDVAPTIERFLGLQVPKGVDGVVLGDSFIHPLSGDLKKEQSEMDSRASDVEALSRRSRAQKSAVIKPSNGSRRIAPQVLHHAA